VIQRDSQVFGLWFRHVHPSKLECDSADPKAERLISMVAPSKDSGVLDALRRVVDDAAAARVFGSPISQDGVVILPVAKISSGAGGGIGARSAGDEGQPEGSGGGFGVIAKPLGVFVLRAGRVSWRPAIDVNRVVLGGQLVAVTALLVVRALIRARGAGGGVPRTAEPTWRRVVRDWRVRAH
jgi:uncharacterized spore protein YtfJ